MNQSYPPVVSRSEWVKARKKLLTRERALTRERDSVSAERRRLPMVKVEAEYRFQGSGGPVSLLDLFSGRTQLIVYHFMFDPDPPPPGKSGAPWDEGCPGCSHMVDNMPHLSHLHARDTSLVLVSRAPLTKIIPFQKRMGWTVPWYSSFGTAFNYDFHVSFDETAAPLEYNYASEAELSAAGQQNRLEGELPGISIFLRRGEEVFHTYSTYARGLDPMITVYQYLDLTPYGRQEKWESSPPGWPQTETHGWLRHHDRYEEEQSPACCGKSS